MIGENEQPDCQDAGPDAQTVFDRLLTLGSVEDSSLRGGGAGGGGGCGATGFFCSCSWCWCF